MTTTPDALAGLAARLTDPTDRETYAALMVYRDSLPPGDEVRQMLHLFGLLTLLGQRVPNALAEALTELREVTTTASDYHAKVDERLANLPREITDGLDLEKMAEAFRQQFAATGLQSSAGLLRDASKDISALSNQISATLAPLGENYTKVAGAIATELEKLTLASRSMQAYNAQLLREQPGNSWQWQSVLLVIMFLLGGLCGVLFEKGQTAEVMSRINMQIERLRPPVAPPVVQTVPKKRGTRG